MHASKSNPSLKADEVAKLVAKAFSESNLEVEVDDLALGLYLALTVSRAELTKLGLARVTNTWKKADTGSSPPGITTAEVFGKVKDEEETEIEDGEDTEDDKVDKSLFDLPKASPTYLQRRKMISLAIEVGIKACMKGHMYQIDGKIYLQSDGGPIGLELSGALARVTMLLWDRQLLRRLDKASANTSWDLYAYLRYVDDGNCAGEEAPLGMRYVRGKFVIKPELVEEDKEVPGDRRTAELVQTVANSIFKFIKVEVDYPSLHPDRNMVPILDLEVGVVDNKLTWQFYRKKMANIFVLMERSAMPNRQKKKSFSCSGGCEDIDKYQTGPAN